MAIIFSGGFEKNTVRFTKVAHWWRKMCEIWRWFYGETEEPKFFATCLHDTK